MQRDYLINEIRTAVEGLGMTFYTGTDYDLSCESADVFSFRLSPLKLISSEGFERRTDTYRVTAQIVLSRAVITNDYASDDEIWHIFEDTHFTEMCIMLRDARGVRDVLNMKCTPRTTPVDPNDPVSMTVEFDLKTTYWKYWLY